MNSIQLNRRDSIFGLVYILFFLSLFISFANAAKVILMGVLIIVTFFYNSYDDKKRVFRSRHTIWWMLAFGIYLFLSAWLASDNHRDALRSLEKRLPLLLFPLSMGLIQITKELRNRILFGFAIVVCFSCLASLVYSLIQFYQTNNTVWLYNDALSFFIRQQSIYTSLLVNISIYIFTYFIIYGNLSFVKKIWSGIAILFLLVISYMLASRNMMVILYGSALVFIFYYILKQKKYLQGFGLLAGMLILVLVIFQFFPNTIKRFKELAYTQFNYNNEAVETHYASEFSPEQWNGANFRLAAWSCGWQLFKEHPIFGVGLGDKTDKLNQVYRQKDFQFAIRTEKNVHNNYLDILFSLGVAGFLLFIAGWVLGPLIVFIRSRDRLALLILINFLFAMISENYFDRSLGGMLFGFFIPFLLSCHTLSKKQSNQ